MSRSSTPATQNDITACFETFNEERLCSFPHRHCDGTTEASDSRRDILGHQNEHFVRDFLAFHTLQLHNRRFPTPFLTNPRQNRRFVRYFRRFSRRVTKCHACHGVCTLSPLRAALTMRFAKKTQQDTSKVMRLPCNMTWEVSKVLRLPQKMQRIFWKHRKSIAPATQNNFGHVMKHVGMSQSATPATRNEAARSWKTRKVTTFAELIRGTAIWSSRGRLRTVANGCGRLRTVADGCATYERLRNVWRAQLYTHTPRGNGNPCYAFGNKVICDHLQRSCLETITIRSACLESLSFSPKLCIQSLKSSSLKVEQYPCESKHGNCIGSRYVAAPGISVLNFITEGNDTYELWNLPGKIRLSSHCSETVGIGRKACSPCLSPHVLGVLNRCISSANGTVWSLHPDPGRILQTCSDHMFESRPESFLVLWNWSASWSWPIMTVFDFTCPD